MPITLDSSGIIALINQADAAHPAVMRCLADEPPPFILPVPITAEVTYLIESWIGQPALIRFCTDVMRGSFILDCCEGDYKRIQELVRRYGDMPLGFSDAAVIACAERNGGRVLTLDRRHFGVVAREGTIRELPEQN